MNRKQFLSTFGGCCGAVSALKAAAAQPASAETPVDRKYAFSQTWVKRFMSVLDQNVDEPTRKRLMQSQGRVCYEGAHGKRPPERPARGALDKAIEGMKKYGGEEMIRREGDTIHFQYIRNPAGLKVKDGYCLCPVVEKGPEGLSGTYCECSVGYVTEMFQRWTEKTVTVELLESLKRGGSGCKFKILLT